MSTHNFQFELEERSYAVQVTPFDQEGRSCYRATYNDSSNLIFCPRTQERAYDISGNAADQVSEQLKAKLEACVEAVRAAEADKPGKLSTTLSIDIDRDVMTVWRALTDPELVRQYFFGTTVSSDWQAGSPISYQGEYQGKTYKDKGTILKADPGKILQHTYWSSMGGKEDKPENYNTVTYSLSGQGDHTRLSLQQDNIRTEAEKEHSTQNWEQVLQQLKQVTEAL